MMASNHLPDHKDLTEMSQSAFSETTYQGVGFGLGFSVILDPVKTQSLTDVGEYGWGGAASTVFLTQLLGQSERRNGSHILNSVFLLPSFQLTKLFVQTFYSLESLGLWFILR